MIEIKWQRYVRVICDLEVGDMVTVDGFGHPLVDGKYYAIEEIFFKPGGSESGFTVKINGYPSPLDSNWLDKIII